MAQRLDLEASFLRVGSGFGFWWNEANQTGLEKIRDGRREMFALLRLMACHAEVGRWEHMTLGQPSRPVLLTLDPSTTQNGGVTMRALEDGKQAAVLC